MSIGTCVRSISLLFLASLFLTTGRGLTREEHLNDSCQEEEEDAAMLQATKASLHLHQPSTVDPTRTHQVSTSHMPQSSGRFKDPASATKPITSSQRMEPHIVGPSLRELVAFSHRDVVNASRSAWDASARRIKAMLTQLGSVAETAAESISEPGQMMPAFGLLLAVSSAVLVCLVAVWQAFGVAAMESKAPTHTASSGRFSPQDSARPSMISRPQTSPLPVQKPINGKDPWKEFVNASSKSTNAQDPWKDFTNSPVKSANTQASPTKLLSVNQLTNLSLSPYEAYSSQSSVPQVPAPSSVQVQDAFPPALCPALVLPTLESHLEVPIPKLDEILKASSGTFCVLGPLGNKIMQVIVFGNAFDIHMMQSSASPVASVCRTRISEDELHLDLLTSTGSLYGQLKQRSSGRMAVYSVAVFSLSGHSVAEKLVINYEPAEFQLRALDVEGDRPIASAAPSVKKRRNSVGDTLEIRTQKKTDTALILACFLGVILMGTSQRIA